MRPRGAAVSVRLVLVALASLPPPGPASLHSRVLAGLGLSKIPDVRRMNVSQGEYAKMMEVYLNRVSDRSFLPRLHTFQHSGGEELSADSTLEMKFRNDLPAAEDVEAASLRVLVSGAATGELRLSALAGAGPRASLALDASFLPRWADLDLGPRAQLSHLRLRAHCPRGCHLRIERAVLNVVAAHSLPLRPKRDDDRRRTDCYSGPGPGAGKRERCCRHEMQVVFRELPGYEFIIQPYGFDAGFCKGACPYRFNPANHHSSLQSLLWRQKKGSAPRPCCAPSKLDRLEILHLDESDPTRLKLAKWTNMKVTECACF